MKRDLTASAVSVGARSEGGAEGSVAKRRHTAWNKKTHTQPGSSKPRVGLAAVSPWTHTLVLSGELNHRSAHMLEAEIDRVCEEGITGITLDLRALTYVDSIGVAVIVFRCGLCKRRGYDFSLIPGSRFIRRAFEQAGVIDLLPFQEDDVAAPWTTRLGARPPFSRRLRR
jgi:anti-anti-sigma factor